MGSTSWKKNICVANIRTYDLDYSEAGWYIEAYMKGEVTGFSDSQNEYWPHKASDCRDGFEDGACEIYYDGGYNRVDNFCFTVSINCGPK